MLCQFTQFSWELEQNRITGFCKERGETLPAEYYLFLQLVDLTTATGIISNASTANFRECKHGKSAS